MVSGKESRQKSTWEEDAVLELLFRSPESTTDDDLLSISLSNLAKNLHDKLPAHTTMKIYLRWLEVHRKSPSQLFKAWPNTTKHWVESLKHRGFDKETIIANVEDWRKTNGPFSKQSKGWAEEKYPPSVDDIERAFDNQHNQKKDGSLGKPDSFRGGYRSEKSSSKIGFGCDILDHVPQNYICNRCGKNGHSVKQCPTNMDPAFDRKPPSTYQCSICNKFGKHWYSLCPKNIREDSITQRRLAAGIKVPTRPRSLEKDGYRAKLDEISTIDDIKHEGRDRDSRHRRSEKMERSKTSGATKREKATAWEYDDSEGPEVPARSNKLELLADIEERIHQASATMAEDTGMSIEGVTEMTGVKISNMAATIMAANRKRAHSVEMDDVDYSENRRTIRQKVEYDDKEELIHDVEDTRFLHSDDERHDAASGGIFKETDPYTEEFGLRQNSSLASSTDSTECSLQLPNFELTMRVRKMSPMYTSSEEDIRTPIDDMEEGFDSPRVPSETPEKVYSDFVKRLIENRTEGQIVNQRRRSRTALECWDEDDERRMGRLNISTSSSQISPTLSSISSLDSNLTDDVIEVDHPLDHTSDQALGEIPYFNLDDNTACSPDSDTAMLEAMSEASKHVNEKTPSMDATRGESLWR